MGEQMFLVTLLNSLHFTYLHGGITEMEVQRNQHVFKFWLTNPFTLVSYISKGRMVIETKEGAYPVHAGEAVIVPAHIRHKITILQDMTLSHWLNINFTLFEHFQVFDLIETPLVSPPEIGMQIGKLHEGMTGQIAVDQIDPDMSLYHMAKVKKQGFELLELILSISHYHIADMNDISKYQRFQPVFMHIDNHLDRKIKVSELAELLHLSDSHFYKEFKESFDMSPLQYIQMQRLKRSQYLLATTHLTIDEIASQVGYRDTSQFVRFFKLKYGSSPSQYKKTMVNSYSKTSRT